jgi:hypothetical protein
MKRFLRRLLKLTIASALLAAALYAGSEAFGERWRAYVIQRLGERGLHMDFRRLVLDPFGGLMARDVRLYSRADRRQLLVSVDRLRMDVEFGRLLEKRFEVQGFELTRANLSIPVDPPDDAAGAEPTMLEVRNLSARAFLRDRRLELRHAEGELSGIRLNLSGDLQLPAPDKDKPEDKSKMTLQDRIKVLRNHQQRIQKGLDWLQRFQFATPPRLSLEMHGEIDRPLEMNARLVLEADGMSYGSYTCREVVAEAEFRAGLMDLTRFFLRDATGQVSANATWRMASPELNFHLSSSADLPGLAQAFLSSGKLREIVFYESPNLALDGIWFVDGELAPHKRPVRVTGSLDCGRFSTRGAVFDGLSAKFGVAPEGVYIRDFLLRHQTGTLSAQVLTHEEQGFRYRALLRMDPNAFLPFAQMEQTREILRRFEFSPRSNIFFELEGAGPKADLQECLNQGRGELRNFKYRGVDLELLSADVEFKDPKQHYRNVRLQRPEGVAEVAHIEVDDDAHWVRLTGLKSGVDPVAVTSCFAPKTAAHIAKYRLPVDTTVELDGLIDYRGGEDSDFKVSFRHEQGEGQYTVLGEDCAIVAPQGDLHILAGALNFDVRGRVHGGAMSARGQVSVEPGRDEFAVDVKAVRFPREVFGRNVPFENVTARVTGAGETTNFDVKARLLGGSFDLKGRMQDSQPPRPYRGELRLDGVSFQRFAQIYSKTAETEGDLTGHFRFDGREENWKQLKGEGAAIILNGNLYAVPILGPLTPLLDNLLPGKIKDYNVATEANCTFRVADGSVTTENFEALTSVFKLASRGRINFIDDEVDLTTQVRVRGLPGIVLRPFSELFEFRGEGTVKDTRWTPSLLKGVPRDKDAAESPKVSPSLRLPLPSLPSFFNRTEPRKR